MNTTMKIGRVDEELNERLNIYNLVILKREMCLNCIIVFLPNSSTIMLFIFVALINI